VPGAVAAEQHGIRLVDHEHGLILLGLLERLPLIPGSSPCAICRYS
jgi:hypothetical protein